MIFEDFDDVPLAGLTGTKFHTPPIIQKIEVAEYESVEEPITELVSLNESGIVVHTEQPLFASFYRIDGKIYERTDKGDPVYICSPLELVATYSKANGKGWGKLFKIQTPGGAEAELRVSNADLQRSVTDIIASFSDLGFEIGNGKEIKTRFIDLLKGWKVTTHMTASDRSGWLSEDRIAFLAGSDVIGALPVLPPSYSAPAVAVNGSARDWYDGVGCLCCGNPMMILAVSLALSGPLLALLGMGSGGLHFRGSSSSGKTTLLRLACSVWGSGKMIQQWRATANGLEVMAQSSNDMLLALDEIAEISGRELGGAIYMLGNGAPKTRMNKRLQEVEAARWNLALISSGEVSIAAKLKDAGQQVMAGHEVRLIDVEADAQTYGVFDNLHGCQNAGAFADRVQAASSTAYGAVGQSFVQVLMKLYVDGEVGKLKDDINRIVAAWETELGYSLSGQVLRVARRFAVLAVAGAKATVSGLTGWGVDAAERSAEQAFMDWYDRHHGASDDALVELVSTVQGYLSSNDNSILKVGDMATDPSLAVWRDDEKTYLPQHVWSTLFSGVEGTEAAKRLAAAHLLYFGEDNRLMRRSTRAIPGRPRFYTLNTKRLQAFKAL